ncbi:Mov34/MPN/PAD-1 family protein [Crossiella sp. SN42]|uniref:Mov34/MPN/PAD-1 family protein n=1 Tax=Crossiella sp. SN42 TaxID=2944808 RepID=UPI00207C54B3|nr:Mov34/MPN/PAD-1 family protein [Crossiella sp. SN42]MCO1575618.1 Mov34/MPN/PAD-1 family protein [Crossiella sp. SN42]
MTTPIPKKIVLTASAISVITDEARASTDGSETGGILLGTAEPDAVIVRHAGRPGPDAIRQPDFFQRDLHHAQSFADRAYTLDRSIWIGEWHTHLHTSPRPSSRDLATYQALLGDPELAFDYFVAIILADHTNDWHTPQLAAWIVTPTHECAVPAHRAPGTGAEDV